MTLLRELWDNKPIDLTEGIMEAANKVGGLMPDNGFSQPNQKLVAKAAKMAVNSYYAYSKNKRSTIRLYAKSPYERKMMTTVVDALLSTKKFKIEKTRFTDGAKEWTLRRLLQ